MQTNSIKKKNIRRKWQKGRENKMANKLEACVHKQYKEEN
jgi:hypothetical protein